MKKAFFLLIIVSGTFLNAQNSFFNECLGNWKGEGSLFGRPAVYSMRWENALDETFIKLEFTNQIVGTDRAFRATAFYPKKAGEKGTWLDNRGITQVLTIAEEGNKLTVIWESATETGKTIYTLIAVSKIEVQDFVFKDNDWKLFGSASYGRVE